MIDRWRQQPAAVQDLVLSVLLGTIWFGLAAYWEARGWHPRYDHVWDLAGLTSGIMVALRRWGPPVVLVAVVLTYPVLYDVPLQSEFHLLPVLIAAYVAPWHSTVGGVFIALASLASGVLLSTGWLHRPRMLAPSVDWSGVLFHEFAVTGMVLLGVLTASHRRTAAVLAARNAELERLRAIEAERAVAIERTRIARELHDDVAHHLTALLVRAQAAERVSPSRPEVAVESMNWIADTARYALSAMRRTVSVLRDGEGAAELAPGPTLDALPAIVDRVQEAGLSVTLEVHGGLPPLGPQVQHAVVRVVQESLTNVLRHAHARCAAVTLLASANGLTVVVEDDGTGSDPASVPQGGVGLVGMRERAESCGGSLEIDRGALGGWRVRGWFPDVATATGA